MRGVPIYWKSLVTGHLYNYKKYFNHGKGGVYREYVDLPKDEYPYTLVYQERIPLWQINNPDYPEYIGHKPFDATKDIILNGDY